MKNDRRAATMRPEKASDSSAAGQQDMRNNTGKAPSDKKEKPPYRRYQLRCKKYMKVQNG